MSDNVCALLLVVLACLGMPVCLWLFWLLWRNG